MGRCSSQSVRRSAPALVSPLRPAFWISKGKPAARTFSPINAGNASFGCTPKPAVRLSPRKTTAFDGRGAAGSAVWPNVAAEKKQRASAIRQIAGIVFLMRGESCSRKQDEPASTVNDSIIDPERSTPHENLRDQRRPTDRAQGRFLQFARGRDLLDPRAIGQRKDDAAWPLRRAGSANIRLRPAQRHHLGRGGRG